MCVWGCQLVDSRALVETVTDHASPLGKDKVAYGPSNSCIILLSSYYCETNKD